MVMPIHLTFKKNKLVLEGEDRFKPLRSFKEEFKSLTAQTPGHEHLTLKVNKQKRVYRYWRCLPGRKEPMTMTHLM
jgi:hypothetical protein